MRKKIEIIGFILGGFAVIAQLVLIIQNRQAAIPETIIRFFSFFTILTNILLALFFASRVFRISGKPFALFHKKGALTALTTFILIVGIVYQAVLRWAWEPQGLQLLVDELLHTVIPLYALFYWIIFSTKEKINFRDAGVWLLYPVVYILFILARGSLSNYYPYPFLNVSEIGLGKVLLHSGLVLLVILVVMGIFVSIKNKRATNQLI